MSGLGAFWRFLTTPILGPLGRTDWFVLVLSAATLVGAWLYGHTSLSLAPAGIERLLRARIGGAGRSARSTSSASVESSFGPSEAWLRAEFQRKASASVIAWALALMLSLLLRLLGLPGVSMPALEVVVFVTAPLLVGYLLVYRLLILPRYLTEARRIDVRRKYEPGPRAQRSRGRDTEESAPEINLWPTKAVIGTFASPFIYYLALTPHDARYHDLHQLGMFIAALLGYMIGLLVSLGDAYRSGDLWARRQRTR